MIMHDFEYVPKEEWKLIRDELFEIIHRLQNELRDDLDIIHIHDSKIRVKISQYYLKNPSEYLLPSINLPVNSSTIVLPSKAIFTGLPSAPVGIIQA